MARLVRAVLPPHAGGTVLDIGCGTGANIASLMRDYTCVGADASAEAVAWCRRRFPGLRVEHGHVPAVLAEVAARADLLLLMDVIEHVRDDFLLLSEILAVARPCAYVLVTVPADASEIEIVGQQWSWSYRFPGRNGRLGTTDVQYVSADNPLGLNPRDPNGQDNIVIIGYENS